jgi:putative Mg2+ transporter-C (MgtC) family protein
VYGAGRAAVALAPFASGRLDSGGAGLGSVHSACLDPLQSFGWTEILLRLGAAVAIGSVLGINRELRGKPAGLRTNSLVALGAALVTLASIGFSMDGSPGRAANSDAVSRVVQGIITGVGFVGAGVIIRDSTGTRVHGLTTAATIWISSALGVLCGAGVWSGALIGTFLTMTVLVLGGPFERFVSERFPRLTENDRTDDEDPRR